jgi:hypothetical protein
MRFFTGLHTGSIGLKSWEYGGEVFETSDYAQTTEDPTGQP